MSGAQTEDLPTDAEMPQQGTIRDGADDEDASSWCLDCDAEVVAAASRCRRDAHALCKLRALEQTAEAELAALRSMRCSALRRLAEDVRREEARLADEESAAAAARGRPGGLAALRAMLGAAKAHPVLHLGDGDGDNAEEVSPLRALQRARVALEEEKRAVEAERAALCRRVDGANTGKRPPPGPVTLEEDGVTASAAGAVTQDSDTAAIQDFAAAAAVQDSAATSTVQDDEEEAPSWMESLPDEVLVMILAAVPVAMTCRGPDGETGDELLSLRLVSRRWSRLVLAPAVWRHRRMSVDNDVGMAEGRVHARRCAVLLVVPALDSLSLGLDSSHSVRGREVAATIARTAATSPCQVHSLSCTHTHMSTGSVTEHLVTLVERCKATLLRLTITLMGMSSQVARLLRAIDDLENLQELRVGLMTSDVSYEFTRMRAVRKLSLPYASPGSLGIVRGMVRACRATLLSLDCGNCDVSAELAACRQLRRVKVRASASLPLLHRAARLEKLTVNCYEADQLPVVRQFLADPRRTVPYVSLYLAAGPASAVAAASGAGGGALRGVRKLTLNLQGVEPLPAAAVLEIIASPDLELLSLVAACDMDALVEGWAKAKDATAPRLRLLHVVDDPWPPGPRGWRRRLGVLRPDLQVCPLDCRRAHRHR